MLNQKLGAVIKGYSARRIWNNVASIRASRILFRHLSQFQQLLIEDKTDAVKDSTLEGKLQLDLIESTLKNVEDGLHSLQKKFSADFYNFTQNMRWLKHTLPNLQSINFAQGPSTVKEMKEVY